MKGEKKRMCREALIYLIFLDSGSEDLINQFGLQQTIIFIIDSFANYGLD